MTTRDHNEEENHMQGKLSEIEIMELLQEAKQQYEAYINLPGLCDYAGISSQIPKVPQPTYSWDTPIGLVIGGSSYAHVV